MTVYLLFLLSLMCFAFWLSYSSFRVEELDERLRLKLGVLAGASLAVILFFASIGVFPKVELILPINGFVAMIQSTLWYAFVFLFFACLMFWVEKRQRRALLVMNVFFVFVFLFRIQHLFFEPSIYRSEANARDGLCSQTTSYSCGASSVANYLSLHDIYVTEGEAASQGYLQPYGGMTLLQATWAVNEFLKRSSSKGELRMKVLNLESLKASQKPFLTVVILGNISHLVCVEKVADGQVYVKDSTRGDLTQSFEDFLASSRLVMAI